MASSSSTTNAGGPGKDRFALAKQRKEQRDKAQSAAYGSLPVGGLFIGLFVRDDPHRKDDFHWGFYHHASTTQGTKYHITGSPGQWRSDHKDARNTFTSQFLSVLVKIGQIPQAETSQLDRIMKSHDEELNTLPGITCRVWLFRIVAKLVTSGMINLRGSVVQLETECKGYGNQFSDGDAHKQQPRPVVSSTICS